MVSALESTLEHQKDQMYRLRFKRVWGIRDNDFMSPLGFDCGTVNIVLKHVLSPIETFLLIWKLFGLVQ